jgi:uncharacterized protein (TIGR03086 family)
MAEPVVIERIIDAPPQEAFDLLTRPDRLRRWQALSASIDLRVGGDYRFTIVPGSIAEGTITEIDPGRRIRLTWGWSGNDDVPPGASDLVIELEPQGDGTLVRFRHSGLEGEQAAGHAEGWNHYGDRLAAAAAAGDAGADEWAAGPEDLDHLTAAEASWALCQQIMRKFRGAIRDDPTTCADFTIHELVEHLMASLRSLGAAAGAEVPETIDADNAEDYIAQAVEPTLAAWRDRGLDGEVKIGDRSLPAEQMAGVLALEFFIHGWDFAQSIGEPFDAPPHLVAYIRSIADNTVRPESRGEGKAFASEQTPTSDDPIDELMAFTGRRPLAAPIG